MSTEEAAIKAVAIPSTLELCPDTLMPSPADMKNMIKQLAAMPAKILAMLKTEVEIAAALGEDVQAQIAALDKEALGEEAYKEKVEELAGSTFQNLAQNEIDGLMSEVEQLREVVETVLDVIDAPNFASIEWPDLRGEIGVDKIFQKYPTFLIVEIIKIINKILTIKLETPVPPLGINVDILKFVGDKDYKAELIAELTGNGPDIKALLADLDPTALGLEAYTNKVNELKASTDLSAEEITAQIAALNPDTMGIDAYMGKVNELKGGIIDPLYDLLPAEWQSFGGEEGLEIPELKGEAVIAYIESKMASLGIGFLMDLFGKLIKIFDKIWKLLGLPDLPIPLDIDIGAMIKEIVDAEMAKFTAVIEELESLAATGKLEGLSEDVQAQIAALDKEALGEEAYNEAVEALAGMTLGDAKIAAFDEMSGLMTEGLEGLKVAGFSVMDMIGGPIDDPVETLALKKKRICEEIGRFKDNYFFFLLRKWMEIITSFLDAIGLGKIVEFIGLDFCTFLGLLGFPKALDLSFSDHITEVASTMNTALPTAITLTAAETAAKNVAASLPRYTTAANQTTFIGTDDNNNTLSYTYGETTVFKTGVSLEDFIIDETDGDKILVESSNEISRGEDGSVKDDIMLEVSSQYTLEATDIITEDDFNIIPDTEEFVLLEDCFLLLEDGEMVLYEDGSNIMFEGPWQVIQEHDWIILEDDGILLSEDSGLVFYEDDYNVILNDNFILDGPGYEISLTEPAEEGDIIFIVQQVVGEYPK